MKRGLLRTLTAFKAFRQLGGQALFQYGRYQFALRSGALRRNHPSGKTEWQDPYSEFELPSVCLLPLPDPEDLKKVLGASGIQQTMGEANEIVSGKVRLFGGDPVPLQLVPSGPLRHWTAYELGQAGWGSPDVKLVWEPARFGWAFTLGRAYHLSRDERFPAAFWQQAEVFLQANPTNLGPHWASAQEVGLRLMAFGFALCAFGASPETSRQRQQLLRTAIAAHAQRIPATLAYARSQHNNHLLTEAAALLTAGLLLPQHPASQEWQTLGRRWLNQGFQEQIDEAGGYSQNSTNYHRLMLQTALWAHAIRPQAGSPYLAPETRDKLGQAVVWLARLVDPQSGRVPNLGPNDGAYILPFSSTPFHDFRPVLQAASLAFLEQRWLEPGPWDEMALWFCAGELERDLPLRALPDPGPGRDQAPPHVLRSATGKTWAYLRAAHFSSRPGHADQLHLDLWWQGLNLAHDPGTFFYNAPPPWENALARTAFHNTLTINGMDQMQRAGRFLWLDWAQAETADPEESSPHGWSSLAARHTGYQRLGVIHQRQAALRENHCLVQDRLLPVRASGQGRIVTARLHWLLPDWEWELAEGSGLSLALSSPAGKVRITLSAHSAGEEKPLPAAGSVARAGSLLYGSETPAPQAGWFSPTYAHLVPALSLSLTCTAPLPFGFTTRWQMGEKD